MTDIDPIYLEIGLCIREQRLERHISAAALATTTHLPIGRMEMGIEPITAAALYAIARSLHCSVHALLPEQPLSPTRSALYGAGGHTDDQH